MQGKKIGRYIVEEPLGRGGMGVVWKARDLRLDRRVALKFLPSDTNSDPIARKRFLREARLASSLSHPNIITVYEIDEDDGIDFMAMELIPGQTLAQRLELGPLPPAEARTILRQVVSALCAAHSSGIIHRDLKPSNIMLKPDGSVKVLDFGLAQEDPVLLADSATASAQAQDTTRTQLTGAGASIGTFGYMSPEQLLGEKVDARSDIFSLGVVWFEMLVKQSPFPGANRSERMRRMLRQGAQDIRNVTPTPPDADAALVMRCLESAPEARFQTIQEFAANLSPLDAPPPAPHFPVRRLLTVALLLVSVLLAAFIYFKPAVPFLPAPRQSAPELLASARQALLRYDLPGHIDQALTAAESALKLEPNSAPSYQLLAHATLFKFLAAKDPLLPQQALQHARKAIDLDPYLASAHADLAWANNALGQLAPAKSAIDRALELDPKNAHSHTVLGDWLNRSRRFDDAAKSFLTAQQLGPNDLFAFLNAGSFHYRRGNYQEALRSYEAARAFAPDSVRVLSSLSSVYHMLDRNDDAASALQRAIEIAPSASLYGNLGTLRFFEARYADALPAMQKAIQLGANEYMNWGNLADTQRWVPGQREASLESYRVAIRLARESLAKNPDSPDLAAIIALYSAKSGDKSAASAFLLRLPSISKPSPILLYESAVTAELLSQRTLALDLLSKALQAGYSLKEVKNDPELASLRADPNFRRLENRLSSAQ